MTLAFTGHRPNKLGGYAPNPTAAAVKHRIRSCLDTHAPDLVLSGMALGVDQWAAMAACVRSIPYHAVIPFAGFDNRWPEESRAVYRWLLSRATKVVEVCRRDTLDMLDNAYQLRNQYLVDNCDLLAAVWDGTPGGTANCLAYARKVGRPYEIIYRPEGA